MSTQERIALDMTIRNGRSLGTLTRTPGQCEGICELTLSREVAESLAQFVWTSLEVSLHTNTTDLWRALGFHGAAYSLLFHMMLNRLSPPREELVRLFAIDEAEHGALDCVIDDIHALLRRIEKCRA